MSLLPYSEQVYLLHYHLVHNYKHIQTFQKKEGLTNTDKIELKKYMMDILNTEFGLSEDVAETTVIEMIGTFYEDASNVIGICDYCEKAIKKLDLVCYLANDDMVHEKCCNTHLKKLFVVKTEIAGRTEESKQD